MTNTGKTILLWEIMARCILPADFGGKECEVLFFNCDHKFSMLSFIKILEKLFHQWLSMASGKSESSDVQIAQIIERSLNNLKIYNCYTSDDLEFALIDAAEYIFNNTKVASLYFGISYRRRRKIR